MDSMMKEPFPMELVGDFWAADPIFKGCYGDSLLYSDTELCWLRQWEIHLPVYQGEIPMPLAPSYLQAREPKVSKQSPPRAAAPDTPAESPKVKHSPPAWWLQETVPTAGLGTQFQTLSTPRAVPRLAASATAPTPPAPKVPRPRLQPRNPPEYPLPSSSKRPTSNSQEKSPKARSSHKHGHSPSLAAKSVGRKWKDVCTEDSHILNTTLPISSSRRPSHQLQHV